MSDASIVIFISTIITKGEVLPFCYTAIRRRIKSWSPRTCGKKRKPATLRFLTRSHVHWRPIELTEALLPAHPTSHTRKEAAYTKYLQWRGTDMAWLKAEVLWVATILTRGRRGKRNCGRLVVASSRPWLSYCCAAQHAAAVDCIKSSTTCLSASRDTTVISPYITVRVRSAPSVNILWDFVMLQNIFIFSDYSFMLLLLLSFLIYSINDTYSVILCLDMRSLISKRWVCQEFRVLKS